MADVYRIPNAIILIRQTPQWICSNFFVGAQTCWGLFKAIRCFFSYTLVHGWERAPSSGAHVTAASFRHNTHAHVDTDSGEERKKKKHEHTHRRIIVYLHRMVGQTPTLMKKPLICFFFLLPSVRLLSISIWGTFNVRRRVSSVMEKPERECRQTN